MKQQKTTFAILTALLIILTAGIASSSVILDNFATLNQTTTINHPELHVNADENGLEVREEPIEEEITISDEAYSISSVPEEWHDLDPLFSLSDSTGDDPELGNVDLSAGDETCTIEIDSVDTEERCDQPLDLEGVNVNEFELDFSDFNGVEFEAHPYVVFEGGN